ncbi:MAG: ATP-binding protein [Hydrogenophaga sp.]|uniref:sensor histidine kinase n=1 Tax=Hydrogenophaga sp. TaxID=1904254 RepID=UPI001D375EDF|nr:ATP-binding protein [Hydrogenophaga sp.]MBX3610465.1 ATP-binding protein [Hydrogenophaga sp.]
MAAFAAFAALAVFSTPVVRADEALVVPLMYGTVEDLDDGSRHQIDHLPARRTLAARHHRHFRLTLNLSVPDPTAAPLWALYFVSLNDGGRIAVNGTVVGEVPSSTPTVAVQHVRPFYFVVSPALLHTGHNEVTVTWTSHDSLQHLAQAYLGPADVVMAAYERRLFWQNTMAGVGFDLAIVSAALLLGIHAMRREERRYLLMGITSLGWAVVCVAYFLPPMPAPLYPYWHALRLAGIAVTACATWLFLIGETGRGHRRYAALCIAWAAVGPLGHLLNVWTRDLIYAPTFETLWGVSLLLLGVYPLALMARSLVRSWDWRHAAFLVAATAGLLAGVADVSLAGSGSSVFHNTGYVTQATSPIWFSAIVLVLVRDFAGFLAQQRRQQQELAWRLQEQQIELQRLHADTQKRERERAAVQERQRIMQDMHDGLGSQLVSSLALAERGALGAAQTSALLRDCLDDLRLAIDSMAEGSDSFAVMLGNLRFRMAPRLRAAGMGLQWQCAELDDAHLPTPVQALPLLRIVQECLSNAIRHSCAQQIRVHVASSAQGLQVEITDDGKGFDPATTPRGKGLGGMEKRARSLGAHFVVVSRPTAGTQVRLDLPWQEGEPVVAQAMPT